MPDGFASSMLRAAIKAAEDFLAEADGVNKYWAQKILFGDTDISRFANVAMRSAQHCAALTSLPGAKDKPTRLRYDVHEMAVALHWWVRQLHIHHGFYISRPAAAPSRQGGGPDANDGDGGGAPDPTDMVQTVRQFEASLSKEDWLQRAIIRTADGRR